MTDPEAMAVSETTGLTVLTVARSSRSVSLADRAEIASKFPHVVLINSYGTGGLQLGLDQAPMEVSRQLASLKEEMPGLDFSLDDVSARDPFAYFEGWTVIPRVAKTGRYQLLIQLKPGLETKRSVEDLLSGFNVAARVVAGEGEMLVQVSHVLELIAYSDCLGQQSGLSLERQQSPTWQLRPAAATA